MRAAATLPFVLAAACASGPEPQPAEPCPEPTVVVAPSPEATARDAEAISAALDDWHAAAAEGDEERYFAYFTDDAVFLGTDATERWTVGEFQDYAHPHFEDGQAWVMRPVRREIVVRGDIAYFDEDLESEGLGPVRGSGVLRRTPEGWAIAHYALSFTIPNERVGDLREMLAAETSGGEEETESEDGAED